MYLKRTKGPRTVRLPDGSVMTRADLPPPDTARWVVSRKAAVVRGLAAGLLTRQEALERYGLSEEELDGWIRAAARYGPQGLRATVVHRDGAREDEARGDRQP